MGSRIDQFCEDLRKRLTAIDNRLDGIKAKIETRQEDAERAVRDHIAELKSRAADDHANVEAAKADARVWIDHKKAETADQIASWKAARQTAKLIDAADEAERYAAVTLDIAIAAIDEAEQAALEAWLARQDADTVQAA